MENKQYIIEKGMDIGFPDLVKKIEITQWKEYPILNSFDYKSQIGTCKVFKEDNVIKMEITHLIDEELKNLYPAIGFNRNVRTGNLKLLCVSLSESGNEDPSIKRLNQQ